MPFSLTHITIPHQAQSLLGMWNGRLGRPGWVLMLLESFAHKSSAKQDMGGAWEG